MKTIGVLGSGQVGQVLADGFLKHGYAVRRGSRDVSKLAAWQSKAGAHASVGDFVDTAKAADLVVLAVKGHAAEDVVRQCKDALAGKVVLDATNPIQEGPPDHGVVRFFTGPNESLMERLQALAPDAKFVKAFSCVGNALMVNPKLTARPSMFICGDDAAAKATTQGILEQFGWDTEDVGGRQAARAIEPMCMLWCIPGFLKNDWMHAFKMVRP